MAVLSGATMTSAAKGKSHCRPSDFYGVLAVMAENKISISLAAQWDLRQRRQWPPPPYQAYCTKHFIQECLIYYSLEREGFETEEDHLRKRVAIHRNFKQISVKPSRVQPSRKAKRGAGAATQGDLEHFAKGRKAAMNITKIEGIIQARRTQRQLHLTWSAFQAHLEAIIGVKPQGDESQGTNNKLEKARTSGRDEKKYIHHAPCPFQSRIPPECRYCHHKPPTTPIAGRSPEHRAPMAPMHPVGLEYIEDQPIHTFCGLRFAVDACGDEKVIVLIGLETRSSEAGLGQRMEAVKENKGHPKNRIRTAK